jgi:two-component system phosphate regulon sensor histidine kinase PhoR
MMERLPKRVLDSLPDPVLLIDDRRTVVDANKAARETLDVGVRGQDLARTLRHPDVLEAVDAVLLGTPRCTAEITLPSSPPRVFTVHAISLDDAELKTDGVSAILVLNDITTAKRAEQMRADFVANASHELRSPLSSLLGFIETLRGPAIDDADARVRFLDIMDREARRMARLIDDLMSLSRVEINEHVRPHGAVDIVAVAESVTDSLQQRAEARGMRIELTVEPPIPTAVGDMDQLVQVARNLVENAVRYGREGTPVRLRVSSVERIPDFGGPGVTLSVSDEGEGIPKDSIPRLTERFYRVDKARSKSLGSTGLGLAIVKHIVNRHRGRLIVDSEVGKGSTFTVFIPSKDPDPAA